MRTAFARSREASSGVSPIKVEPHSPRGNAGASFGILALPAPTEPLTAPPEHLNAPQANEDVAQARTQIEFNAHNFLQVDELEGLLPVAETFALAAGARPRTGYQPGGAPWAVVPGLQPINHGKRWGVLGRSLGAPGADMHAPVFCPARGRGAATPAVTRRCRLEWALLRGRRGVRSGESSSGRRVDQLHPGEMVGGILAPHTSIQSAYLGELAGQLS